MKTTLLTGLTIIYSIGYSQSRKFPEAISTIYPSQFERAVKAKSFDLLTALYTNSDAKLNVVKKHKLGASPYFNSDAAGWGKALPGIGGVYELRISDAEYFRFKGMAVSMARFDEYIDNTRFADGYDLFTYVLTSEGWRINHMDVSLASDNNLPEKLETLRNESDFMSVIETLKSSIVTKKVIDTLFHANHGGLYVNKFRNGTLIKNEKLQLADWRTFLGQKSLNTDGLETGFIDGHLAYANGELDQQTDLLVTLINSNDEWKISSININRY